MKSIPLKYVGEDQPLYTTEFIINVVKANGESAQIPISLRTYFEVDHITMPLPESCDAIIGNIDLSKNKVISGSPALCADDQIDEINLEKITFHKCEAFIRDIAKNMCGSCSAFLGKAGKCDDRCSFFPVIEIFREIEQGDYSNISSVVELDIYS